MSQLYRASVAGDLIQHDLDSMTLIYQRSSGITHMVADPVPAILENMGDVDVSAETVAENLKKSFEIQDKGDVLNIVCARLDELCELGLVHRVET